MLQHNDFSHANEWELKVVRTQNRLEELYKCALIKPAAIRTQTWIYEQLNICMLWMHLTPPQSHVLQNPNFSLPLLNTYWMSTMIQLWTLPFLCPQVHPPPHYSAEWLPTAYIMICSISMKWDVSHSQKLVLHCLWEGLNLECGRQNVECLQCSCHTWNADRGGAEWQGLYKSGPQQSSELNAGMHFVNESQC